MDRVSNLPDELLCHILSFLTTTKEAALTSVLSKRWRNLFVSCPNLDIDDSEFLHPEEEGRRERDRIFMEFVDRVLALQGNSSINKVSLNCSRTGVDANRVDRWIYNVLARGVSNLGLCIVIGDRYRLHPRGFESRKLVKLKLGSGIDLGWSDGSIYLPMLKTLVLESVQFCADYKLNMLLSACPALEKLVMDNVKGLDDSNETVSSASLKTLIIKSSLVSSGTFSFDTPSLVFLGYSDFIPEDYPLANLQKLSEARISISLTDDQVERARFPNAYDDEYDDAVRLVNMAKLMSGIRNVQTLYFNSTTLEVLSLCCESMPVFNKLKVLVFYSGESRWEAVPVLLKNCPHLELLCIRGLLHVVTETCGDVCACIPREDEGRSIATCPVKRIEIEEFIGTTREITMISHFLEYFPCLEEILITVEEQGNSSTQFDDVPAEAAYFKAQMLGLYYKSLSCNVEIFGCESLLRKLSTAQ